MSLLDYSPTKEERQLANDRTRQKRQLVGEQAHRARQIDEKANLQKQLVRDRALLDEMDDEDADESSMEALESWIEALETEIDEIEQE